jgi:hypothetical protein
MNKVPHTRVVNFLWTLPYSGGAASEGDSRGSGGALDQQVEPDLVVGAKAGTEADHFVCRMLPIS